MRQVFRNTLLASFGAAAVLVALNAYLCIRSVRLLTEHATQASAIRQMVVDVQRIETFLTQAETGQRGYLITGNDEYLEPYTRGREQLVPALQNLIALTASDPVQRPHVQALAIHIDSKLEELAETIQLRREQSYGAARAVVVQDFGKYSMDAAHAQVQAIADEQDVRWRQALDARDHVARATVWMVGGAGTLDLLLLAALARGVQVDARRRERNARALAESKTTLESLYDVGKAIAAQLDLTNVVQTAIDAATRLTNARFGAFYYHSSDDAAEPFAMQTASGAARAAFDGFSIPRLMELFAAESSGRRVIRSADISADPRFDGSDGPIPRIVAAGTPVRSFVAVPVMSRSGKMAGAVLLGHSDPSIFSDRDEKIVSSITVKASIAIDNAHLYAKALSVEEALRKANEGLEQHVNERTAELQSMNDKLRISNRELQDFASVASHDLQEPLRKIQAFGDRLATKAADSLGEEGKDYLRRMQNAAGRMQTLINDLLAFSRVTTKAQPFEPVDLGRIASEVASDLEARVQQTGGRVAIGDLPTIDADPTQMRQLLQNLIGNALKFHKTDEPPVVQLSVAPVAGDAGRIELRVEDNGIGFDEKYLDRIFNVFQRLHGRGQYEGTGIGLAVVRKIAERHDGSVTARSQPDLGTTFIVTLPLHQPEARVANYAGDNEPSGGHIDANAA